MNDDAIRPGIAGTYSVVVADEHVPLHLRGANAEGRNERFIVPRERTNEKLMKKIEEVEGRGVSSPPGERGND